MIDVNSPMGKRIYMTMLEGPQKRFNSTYVVNLVRDTFPDAPDSREIRSLLTEMYYKSIIRYDFDKSEYYIP